ncbi:hypothetical protein LAZ67_1003770 [Cordylochernes scorpioides]|uniref:Transposase n=1 Tax=Cordylochernes scorpioides TaxID=51811 RepID=A0ABY6JYJ9_9ARAC|nr:hypothetical protein LAZ67_1003770 [Cordylochernes scorpioides]
MKDILGVKRLNVVLVPKDLTFGQKNARKETACLNLEATTDNPELLKRVITGDETWIYGFDSETTQQASEWRFKNEPRPKKAKKAPSKVKVMLTVFFDYQGIVHHEFQQHGSTITADSYLGVLRRLREAIRQKRPELWRSKSWILRHDNAPAHTALKLSKFLQDHSTSVFPQPPYSPDLAPCDFFLFGKLKKKLKGRKFQSIEEIKVESKKAMKVLIENGTNSGYKTMMEARDYILSKNLNIGTCVLQKEKSKAKKEGLEEINAHVFAPCTHNLNCPRQNEVPHTPCNFIVQYFSLLPKMQSPVKNEIFSYVILKKGPRDLSSRSYHWPRMVRNTLRRHHHVKCNMCTSEGKLRQVTITPKFNGKDCYHCARHTKWGDKFPGRAITYKEYLENPSPKADPKVLNGPFLILQSTPQDGEFFLF